MSQDFGSPLSLDKTDTYVEALVREFNNKVNYRPKYQRDIRWSHETMNGFLLAIMLGKVVQELIFYRLHDGEARESADHEFECIDGQHRFFVLSKFVLGEPVELKGKKPFMVYIPYKRGDDEIRIFYNKTLATREYCERNPAIKVEYLTEKNRRRFNNFKIRVLEINTPMKEAERQEQFLNLQRGTPVRNSDFFKNRVDVSLIAALYEAGYEAKYKDTLLSRLNKQPERFWLQWLIRMFLLSAGKPAMELADTDITKMINDNDDGLACTEAQITTFSAQLDKFFDAQLPAISRDFKYSPVQFYALFAVSIAAEEDWMATRKRGIRSWMKADKSDKNIGMRPKEKEERMEAFAEIKAALSALPEDGDGTSDDSLTVPKERRRPTKKMRKFIWERDFGARSAVGACYCCEEEIRIDAFEAGHIVANAISDDNTADNLRCICWSCNKDMGTRHMDEYKAAMDAERRPARAGAGVA